MYQATGWVLQFSESKLGSRLVLHSIAYHLNCDTGKAFPSLELIAKECRMTKSGVIEAINRLECMYEPDDLQEIEVKRSDGGSGNVNHYTMPRFWDWWLKAKAIQNGKGRPPKGENGTVNGVDRKTVNPISKTVNPIQETVNRDDPNSKGTIKEQSVEQLEVVSEEEETSSSKEREENPQEAYRLARRIFRKYCKKELGAALGEKQREEWSGFLSACGERWTGVFELWVKENRNYLRTLDYPVSHLLKQVRERIDAYEDQNAPEIPDEEPEEDRMLTAKDIMREREEREKKWQHELEERKRRG